MATALQKAGVMAEQYDYDPEFEKLQRWFRPKQVRRLLNEYHAILDPWQYEDPEERTVRDRFKRVHREPSIFRLADLKASIDSAIAELAVEDRLGHDVIVWLYLERVGWHKTGLYTNLPVRSQYPRDETVVSVEERAVRRMSRFLSEGEEKS